MPPSHLVGAGRGAIHAAHSAPAPPRLPNVMSVAATKSVPTACRGATHRPRSAVDVLRNGQLLNLGDGNTWDASQTSAAPSYGAPASPRRRCPSRSSPPRESSCGGGSTSSEGVLRLGQGAGAASCCSARNMSEFASGRTTACLEGTTKPRSNRTTRPPSNGSVSRKSRSWPPPRRHPFQTAAGCGSTHRMDNPGGGRRWC